LPVLFEQAGPLERCRLTTHTGSVKTSAALRAYARVGGALKICSSKPSFAREATAHGEALRVASKHR